MQLRYPGSLWVESEERSGEQHLLLFSDFLSWETHLSPSSGTQMEPSYSRKETWLPTRMVSLASRPQGKR